MKGLIRRAQQVGLARAICILLLFALVPLRLADPRPLEELRVRTFDFYQVLRPRQQEIRPVVIVDIDEASLKAIGQWPWPRTTVADLVTRITELGAVAIGFDIIFPEPDRMSPAIAEKSFRGIDAETRAKLDSLPSNDEALAAAIKHSRVVVGQAGAATPEPKTAAEAALQTGFAVRGPDPRPYVVTFSGLLRNVPVIEQAAAGRGLFSINPESDGIIRRVPVLMSAQGALVPSLSMELLRVVTGSSAILVRVNDAGVQAVAVPGTNAIIERKGTIDKYIGDAIMAFWNAPVDDEEQEANACSAALEMLARAEALNGELKQEAEANGGVYMPLRIGIGLNTGPCVVGNMGSDFRFNYSVLGDTVNLASRLEGRTKDYRIPVVIGSRTAERAKQKYAVMEIDLIMVKGKKQPEAVFTVLGPAEVESDPRYRDLRDTNAQMLMRFRHQQWDDALEMVARCRKFANGFELSGLYDMYEERVAMYRAHPPAPDWAGVYEAESK
jgi:class 3 adenylate cyclase